MQHQSSTYSHLILFPSASLIFTSLVSSPYLILSYFISSYLIYSVQAEPSFAAIPLPLARFPLCLLSSFNLTSLASKYFYFWSRTLSHLVLFPSSSLFVPPISSSHLILSSFISCYLRLSYPVLLVYLSFNYRISSHLTVSHLTLSYFLFSTPILA